MWKRIILAASIMTGALGAQVTPNLGLNLPPFNSPNWNVPVNANFTSIDSYLSGVNSIPALKITGSLQVGGNVVFTSLSSGCLNVTSSVVGTVGCGNVTVNGTAVPAANLQNGTAGNAITYVVTGSNVQATIQAGSVTSTMLANLLTAGSCSYCSLTFNAKGQIVSTSNNTPPVISFNTRTGAISPQLSDYQSLLLTAATLTAPFNTTDSAGNAIQGSTGTLTAKNTAGVQVSITPSAVNLSVPGGISGPGVWSFGPTSLTPALGGGTGTGMLVLATNPLLPGYVDVTGITTPGNPASGNYRLYFNTGTGLLACLTAGGGNCIPTASWSALTGGVNTNTLQMGSGGVFTYTGTGQVNANYLNGYALPPFTTGSICFTSGALAICPAGTGTVTSAVIAGTSGQIVATGTCTITTSGTCTLSLPSTITATNLTLSGNFNLLGQNFPASAPVSTMCLENTGSAWIFGSCGSGSGSVTTVTTGNLSPLFTVAITNPTTTPAFAFTLDNAAANTLFGNCSGSTGAPSYCAVMGTGANDLVQLTGSALIPTTVIPVFTINTSTPVAASGANFLTSTTNAAGYTLTPSTTGGNGLTFEITGTGNNALAVGGITISGTPASGYVPIATGSSAATWQAFSGLSGLTSGFGVVATGATAVSPTPAFVYASAYKPAPGGDYCALLNGIWTTMTPGSTVIWDIPGQLKCSSNPWAGIYSSGDITVSGSTLTVVRGQAPSSTWSGTMTLCNGTSCTTPTISSCTSSTCTMTGSITGTPTTYGYKLTTIPGTLKFTVPGTLWTNTGWVKPPKTIMEGLGEANASGNGTQAFLIAACPGSGTYCASAFPIDTPVVAEVSNIQDFNYTGAGTTTRTNMITISCAYVQGVRGYMDWYTQENGGTSWPTVRNCGNNGVVMDIGGVSSANGDGNNSSYDHLNLGNNTAETGATAVCTYGALIMRIGSKTGTGSPGPKVIDAVTANSISCQGLTPSININHAVEFGSASAIHVTGKFHTEETSLAAVEFGTYTLLGSVNTSGTTATWVSGDLLPFASGCGTASNLYVNNVVYTLATCSTTGFTTTATMGTQTAAPFSIDTHLGASNISFDLADHCCSANGTGTASGTVFTVTTGQVPQANWTGDIIFGSSSYVISSVNQSAGTITVTATITGSPTTYSYGSIFGIDPLSQTKAIKIGNIKALSPNKPSDMVADGFNTTVSVANDSAMTCYVIDQNHAVQCDDSGVNTVVDNGSRQIGSGSGGSIVGPLAIQYQPNTYAAIIAAFPCNSGNTSTTAFFSDATTNTLGATISSGGGSNKITGVCNGTNYVVMSGATPSLPVATEFIAPGSPITNTGFASAHNVLICGGFIAPSSGLSVGHINVGIVAGDGSNNSDIGIYNSSGSLEAHIGPQTTGAGPANQAFALSGGTQTITAGKSYFCFTSAGTALELTAGSTVSNFYPFTSTGISSTSGTLPSTITPPADNLSVYNSGGTQNPAFILYP